MTATTDPVVPDYGYSQGVGSEIPRFVQFTSPVSTHRAVDTQSPVALPLNLIALITQWIDDTASLAALCRTCRLLYYMTLPQLYQRVALHSYPEIRYVNGRPEGFGGGSPFISALNGLMTQSQASSLVEEFRVWGSWREVGQEDFAKGRVPDNSMMLNILLRAATDKMVKLRTFSWELDCKPLKTLYQGLATHITLTNLTIKFPSSRVPRPSVMIPPIKNLRVFKATDIDPLCYPDDISMLLLASPIEDLRLHFSPRMRREAEPTLSLQTYFGRCVKAGMPMKVKHFTMQNFFGTNMQGVEHMWSLETCRSITFMDTFGGIGTPGNARNVYIDDTWKDLPPDMRAKFLTCRTNEVATQHVEIIRRNEIGMTSMYFISAKAPRPEGAISSPTSPITPGESPPADEEMSRLGKEYLYVLTRQHGQSLRRLLLREEWALTSDDVGDLVRFCPNLEQLGLALNTSNHSVLRLLAPFLPKLKAVRLLNNEALAGHMRTVSHEERMAALSADVWKAGIENLQWMGFGDAVYKVGKVYQQVKEDGTWEWRREVSRSSQADVQHIEIWGLDNLDISADPIVSFSP
ncbi:hypothetical protein B0A55_03440 [Friedmanniomyces simplex]|uniref:Uncharacterized protein n=1 Tax=Friedmanniomyces simplex TaxID=329884 RepID=A0A4U0XQ37_9PEZI|nr:hypothetical protein B0A55_03440 [Friedmanniomyces simplex]